MKFFKWMFTRWYYYLLIVVLFFSISVTQEGVYNDFFGAGIAGFLASVAGYMVVPTLILLIAYLVRIKNKIKKA